MDNQGSCSSIVENIQDHIQGQAFNAFMLRNVELLAIEIARLIFECLM